MAEWYANGLEFTCTQCGKCCTGAPGFVWISEDECDAMAHRLGLEPVAFRRRYTRLVHRKGQPNFVRWWSKRTMIAFSGGVAWVALFTMSVRSNIVRGLFGRVIRAPRKIGRGLQRNAPA